MLWPSTPSTLTVISFTRRRIFNRLWIGLLLLRWSWCLCFLLSRVQLRLRIRRTTSRPWCGSWDHRHVAWISLGFRFRRTATATLRRSIWIWLHVTVSSGWDGSWEASGGTVAKWSELSRCALRSPFCCIRSSLRSRPWSSENQQRKNDSDQPRKHNFKIWDGEIR